MIGEASEKRTLTTYQDQYISIGFEHPDHRNDLDDWCDKLKIARRFDGFDIKLDYTVRLLKTSRIDKEAKQLPPRQPGIIYFPVHILYLQTMDVENTVRLFAAKLEPYKNVMGIVFYAVTMAPLDAPFTKEKDRFIYAVRENDVHVGRYTLFVKDPFFDLQVSPGLINAINRAAVKICLLMRMMCSIPLKEFVDLCPGI